MVTSVELSWDGITRAESRHQINGATGFVEASIFRRNENWVLRQIFPPRFWEDSETPLLYDFIGNEAHAMQTIKRYLQKTKEGGMLTSGKEEWARRADRLLGAVENKYSSEYSLESPETGPSDAEYASEWTGRLWQFIQLGKRLQLQGLHPKILISY